MSLLRQSCSALARSSRLSARCFSNSIVAKVEAQVTPLTTVKPKQPIGGFRGGIVGFLLGFSLASSFAAYHLLEEYKQASAALQASVLELQASTEKARPAVSSHVRRIEAVEKDLKALAKTSASKDDLSRLRAEMKKIYDGLDVEFLNLRSHVWGIQQDLQALSKKNNEEVRI